MTYYDDLEKDTQRVSLFRKAIERHAHGVVYDLGTGSGLLAKIASPLATQVIAIEQNPFIISHTRKIFEEYENIELVETDATEYNYPVKADVVICEMLDTALIDEEQVPVINNAIKYKKPSTIFIPRAVYSTIQLVNTKINNITYYEDNKPEYNVYSKEEIYDKIDLTRLISESVDISLKIKTTSKGVINAILLTTYTIISEDIIAKPSRMLNPPLLIPIEPINVESHGELIINLKYIMGGGLNTIKTSIRRNH
ncbi:MAG: methyltransferase domain-containing protein [Methanosphaera sp.]|nr:methyltransferase domain-containing protein [Methanosphaera sp.]